MNFKRLSSLALCFMLVFAMATTAAANNPVDSPLNDTWRIISGSGVMVIPVTVAPGGGAQDVTIQVSESISVAGIYNISLNGGISLPFEHSWPTAPAGVIQSTMWSSGAFTRVSAGEYNSQGSTNITYRVSGNYLYYEAFTTSTNNMNLRLQRVSSIGTTPPPGGGNGGGAGGGVGGGEGSGGGGGGCNAGFGLFALGFVALSFFYRKRA